MNAALAVAGLEVHLRATGARLLGPIDLRLDPGHCLGLVGESGSGKSLTALAMMDLLPAGLRATGELKVGEQSVALGSPSHRALRGRRLAWMPQDALASLHPMRSLGAPRKPNRCACSNNSNCRRRQPCPGVTRTRSPAASASA